ncbi:YihY/virulence factor BrkB family protein [Lachnospiraceae bacterium ZAX-1]
MFFKMMGRVRFFQKKCKRDNISAYAAQSAFFMILSFIPFLMLFISLVRYTPVTESMILEMVNYYTPEYVSTFLISLIHEIYTKPIGLISITVIVAIWSAAKGVQYLSNGLNAVYDIMETRNYITIRLHAVLDTVVFLIAIVLSLVLLIFGNSLQELLKIYIPFVAQMTQEIIKRRTIIMLAVFVLFFTILYKALPNRKATLRSQLPGGILSAVSWIALSFGLSIYVDYFNGFSMYGSLTTMVLVMLWLYFGMYILLICGEINNIYEDHWAKKNNR